MAVIQLQTATAALGHFAFWRRPDASISREPLAASDYVPDPKSQQWEKLNPVSAFLRDRAGARLNDRREWVRTADGAVFQAACLLLRWNVGSVLTDAIPPGFIGVASGEYYLGIPGKGEWRLAPGELGSNPPSTISAQGEGWRLRGTVLTVD